jgi:predicted HNH restriction endonuclease
VQCEKCRKWVGYNTLDVHHIKPVTLLEEGELWMIWDRRNLIALCHDCHKGEAHGAIYESRRVELEAEKRTEAVKGWKVLF